MKVLVTGASGYIGGAIARALTGANHDVRALVRDGGRPVPDGVEPVRGDLADAGTLAAAIRDVDGVIHAAAAEGAVDRRATERILEELGGSGRFFVYTSGTWVLGDTGDAPAGEDARVRPPAVVAWRPAVEDVVAAAADRGVRAITVRPGLVHGNGGGYVPQILGTASGVVRHFGDGLNRWSMVHVDDLADLFRLAAERGVAGRTYNAVSEVVRVRDAAEAAAQTRGARVASWPADEAKRSWGDAVEAFLLDQVVSGERARRELGWIPAREGVIDGLRDADVALTR